MLNWGCRHSRPTRSHRHHNHNHHHHHHLTLGLKCSSRDHQAFHLLLPSSTPASTSSPTATLCCSGGEEEAREQVPSQETESSTFFNRSTHLVSHSLIDSNFFPAIALVMIINKVETPQHVPHTFVTSSSTFLENSTKTCFGSFFLPKLNIIQ